MLGKAKLPCDTPQNGMLRDIPTPPHPHSRVDLKSLYCVSHLFFSILSFVESTGELAAVTSDWCSIFLFRVDTTTAAGFFESSFDGAVLTIFGLIGRK